MSTLVATAPIDHGQSIEVVGARWRTGVRLLIVADAAFVAALVFTYFYLRGLDTQKGWIPKGSPTAAGWVGWALAGGLVLSAGLYRWAQDGSLAGRPKRLVLGAGLAVLLVAADAVGQVIQLVTFPFKADQGSYASSVYVIAGANLFHLLLTLFIGTGLWNRARLGKYTSRDNWQVRVIGIWWSWIAIAAVITAFTTTFTASPHT